MALIPPSWPPHNPPLSHDTEMILAAIYTLSNKLDAYYLKLSAVEAQLLNKETKIMASLADITAAVAAETTVEASVEALLTTLSADLTAAIANNDPVAIQAVVDQLNTNSAALAAAVTANTPAAPTPAPAPAPTPTPTPTP